MGLDPGTARSCTGSAPASGVLVSDAVGCARVPLVREGLTLVRAFEVSRAAVFAAILVVPLAWSEGAIAEMVRGEPVSRWHGRWYAASSATLGFDAERLAAAISDIGRMRGVQGFLLARRGYLVEEHYWRGGARDKPHNLKSASKSIISALVGIAISKGYFRLDQPIAELLPQAGLLEDPLKKGITVYQLLTMTSGLESTSYAAYNDWVRNPDWITAALQQPLAAPPGSEYRYSTGNTHMLSAILAASTGKPTREFAEQELFKPMGVEVAGWQKDPNGIHLGGNNFSLLPRDAARFAQLYLDAGRWRNRQLVPKSWVAASTAPTDNGPHETYGNYGFLWWTQPPEDGSFAAVGYGGQYIVVSPRHESVVVVLSNAVSKGDRWEARLFELLKGGVLNSLVDPSMPPPILLSAPNGTNTGQAGASVTAIAAANVNLRAEPDQRARRLALIVEGSELELLERNGEWVRGRINSHMGWLHWGYVDWLSLKSEESAPASRAVVKRTTELDAMTRGQPPDAATNRWTIIDRAANEHAERGTSAVRSNDSIGGDPETVIALRSRFDRVRAQVQDLQALLTTNSPSLWHRTTARINFRREPNLNGASLGHIESGTEFPMLGRDGAWFKANIDGVEGWLHSDFLVTVELPPADAYHNDLAAELTAIGKSVRQLLARQQASEAEATAATRSIKDMQHELERTSEQLGKVVIARARLERAYEAKAEELIVAGITQKQRAQELDTAHKNIALLQDALQQQRRVKQDMTTDLTDLRGAVQAQRDQLVRYAATQKRRRQELDAVRAQFSGLEIVLQQEQAAKQGLVEKLERIRDRSRTQRRRLEQLGADQAQRTRELNTARAQLTKLEGLLNGELAAKEDLVDDFARRQDGHQSQRQRLERALQAEQAANGSLTDELARLGAGYQTLRDQRTEKLDAARIRVIELERTVQRQGAEKQVLADDLRRSRDQRQAQSERLVRLEAAYKEDVDELEAARVQNSELEKALQQERGATETLAADLVRLSEESKNQEQRLAHLNEELEERAKELAAVHTKNSDLEQALQQERDAKDALAADLAGLNEESKTQKQRLAHLSGEHEQHIKELAAVRSELAKRERLRSRIRELEVGGTATQSEDVAMSPQHHRQNSHRSLSAEPPPGLSGTETLPPLKAVSKESGVAVDVDALVHAWATAWSERDVGAYLAFYSHAFRPAGGATREAWETRRRRRLTRPSFIEVGIADLDITLLGQDGAQVTFRQTYRAERYQDKVLKTLVLARENDQWRIVRETSR